MLLPQELHNQPTPTALDDGLLFGSGFDGRSCPSCAGVTRLGDGSDSDSQVASGGARATLCVSSEVGLASCASGNACRIGSDY